MINCVRTIEYRESHRVTAVEYARYYRASNGEGIRERKSIHDVTTYLQDIIKKGSTNVFVTFGRFFDRSMSVLKYSQMFRRIKNTCPLITNSDVLGNDDDIDLIEPNNTKNDDKIGLLCSNCS